MYKFTDTIEGASSYAPPSDLMYINGKTIDEQIKGYKHISVSGRDIVGRRIESSEIPGRDGEWVDYITDDSVVLAVTFLLDASSSTELREVYSRLNNLLGVDKPLELRFRDELEWCMYGHFIKASIPKETDLGFFGELEFLIPQYVKYKDKQTSSGAISLTYADKVRPLRVVATPNKALNEIILKSNSSTLRVVNTTLRANTPIYFDWGSEEFSLTHAGRSLLYYIAWRDYPEEFYIKNGDRVQAENCSIRVEWRDERK